MIFPRVRRSPPPLSKARPFVGAAAALAVNVPHALVCSLDWDVFQNWSGAYPEAALGFMKELARMGIRRLGATSQALRAAMA